MQKPDIIKDILQDVYDYSLMRFFTNALVISNASFFEPRSYFSDYFKDQKFSSFLESGMLCLILLLAT